MSGSSMNDVVVLSQLRRNDGQQERVNDREENRARAEVRAVLEGLHLGASDGLSSDLTKVLQSAVVCPLITQRCLMEYLASPVMASTIAAAFAAAAARHASSRAAQQSAVHHTMATRQTTLPLHAASPPPATTTHAPAGPTLPQATTQHSSKSGGVAVEVRAAAVCGLTRQRATELPDFASMLGLSGSSSFDGTAGEALARPEGPRGGEKWAAAVRLPEGIRAVVLDVDDTLVLHKSDRDLSSRWRQMRAAGLVAHRRREEHDLITALAPHGPFLRALAAALESAGVPLYIASFATAPYVRRVVAAVFGARRVPPERLKCFREPIRNHPPLRNKVQWLDEVAEAVGASPDAVLFVDDCAAHVESAAAAGFRAVEVDSELGLGPSQWEAIVEELALAK